MTEDEEAQLIMALEALREPLLQLQEKLKRMILYNDLRRYVPRFLACFLANRWPRRWLPEP